MSEEIKKLKETINGYKERIAYLERSNNRREDTIIGLREELNCCEDKLQDHDKFNECRMKELLDYKDRIDNAVEYINNFSVDKCFSFPLMKKWEENQVKGSIEYEFNDTLKKDLLNILQGSEDNEC